MIKKFHVLFSIGCILGVFLVICSFTDTLAKEKCSIVRIDRAEDQTKTITPDNIYIKKGDCVVWINWIPDEDVKIVFTDADKCSEGTRAPQGFKTEKGCYTAHLLNYGDISSLLFVQEGTFQYEIQNTAGVVLKSGAVNVER